MTHERLWDKHYKHLISWLNEVLKNINWIFTVMNRKTFDIYLNKLLFEN